MQLFLGNKRSHHRELHCFDFYILLPCACSQTLLRRCALDPIIIVLRLYCSYAFGSLILLHQVKWQKKENKRRRRRRTPTALLKTPQREKLKSKSFMKAKTVRLVCAFAIFYLFFTLSPPNHNYDAEDGFSILFIRTTRTANARRLLEHTRAFVIMIFNTNKRCS